MSTTRVCRRALLACVALTAAGAAGAAGQAERGPDTVVVQSGTLRLRGLLWRPNGPGPFPAVLFNHGSGLTTEELTMGKGPESIGPLFPRHGYVLLFLFRRGSGLSQNQGSRPGNALDSALAGGGPTARNRLQLAMLESEQVPDALAGLAYLRSRPDVDARRLAVVGHSFGGSVTLLVAERDSTLRAVVDFSGAALSWGLSAELRARLLAAVRATTAPVLFIHPANDYGVESGPALSAEMTRLGKTALLKIYAAYGSSAREGHNFLFLDPSIWEQDVFAFLDRYLRH